MMLVGLIAPRLLTHAGAAVRASRLGGLLDVNTDGKGYMTEVSLVTPVQGYRCSFKRATLRANLYDRIHTELEGTRSPVSRGIAGSSEDRNRACPDDGR
jgi:hypothetical protein